MLSHQLQMCFSWLQNIFIPINLQTLFSWTFHLPDFSFSYQTKRNQNQLAENMLKGRAHSELYFYIISIQNLVPCYVQDKRLFPVCTVCNLLQDLNMKTRRLKIIKDLVWSSTTCHNRINLKEIKKLCFWQKYNGWKLIFPTFLFWQVVLEGIMQ